MHKEARMASGLIVKGKRGIYACWQLMKKVLHVGRGGAGLHDIAIQVEVAQAPATAQSGQSARLLVKVKNVGLQPWPALKRNPICLAGRWRFPHGPGALIDGVQRVPLPALKPGAEAVVEYCPTVPGTVRDYVLDLDLFQESRGWRTAHGPGLAQVPCKVTASRPVSAGQSAFSYHDFYKEFDLAKDYWRVVGPSSKEEFELLGRAKVDRLISLGLKPTARVLDAGCGTGQVTAPLLDYLAPEGLYFGTDIAKEAVDFCRQQFRRPNFFFVQNEMERIPITGVQFDVILLSSVFTHMFPDEIRGMLVDLKRLLDENGFLFADAFVSTQVAQFEGNRSQVEINERLFLDILAGTGLEYETIERLDWRTNAWRLFFKLTYPGTVGRRAA
jgi:SAM-dependent methyltransferase